MQHRARGVAIVHIQSAMAAASQSTQVATQNIMPRTSRNGLAKHVLPKNASSAVQCLGSTRTGAWSVHFHLAVVGVGRPDPIKTRTTMREANPSGTVTSVAMVILRVQVAAQRGQTTVRTT